jgi:tRNA-Thr(GGU) m(6)t(6)A37 methyltransferase TsaA
VDITLKPLGFIRADFKQKFGTPRQGSLAKNSRAQVELSKEWRGRGILSGLEGFSHVWIVSYLHLSVTKRMRGKIHPPRLQGKKMGVMGSRSPHRPNSLGLTLARILECKGDRLVLAEVDLIDGTPVLDLKPYLALADRPEEYTCGWTDTAFEPERYCEFTDEAEADLKKLEEPERVRALILEMLTQDPRPPAYLGRDVADFAIWVAGVNVEFRYQNGEFRVLRCPQMLESPLFKS